MVSVAFREIQATKCSKLILTVKAQSNVGCDRPVCVSEPSSPQEASERNARNALTVHFRALVIVFANAKCPVSKPFYVTPRLGLSS
jgi:hypothetical protein